MYRSPLKDAAEKWRALRRLCSGAWVYGLWFRVQGSHHPPTEVGDLLPHSFFAEPQELRNAYGPQQLQDACATPTGISRQCRHVAPFGGSEDLDLLEWGEPPGKSGGVGGPQQREMQGGTVDRWGDERAVVQCVSLIFFLGKYGARLRYCTGIGCGAAASVENGHMNISDRIIGSRLSVSNIGGEKPSGVCSVIIAEYDR